MQYTDKLQKFLIDDLHIRGEYVRLSECLKEIDSKHHYPSIIRNYLNELSIATVLLTALVKIRGTITLQLNVNASIKWMVCKCNQDLEFRSLAKWDEEALAQDFEQDLKTATLTVTILRDNTTQPYQAIVPLNNLSITDAIETYFAQSEQLDTKIRIEQTDGVYTAILLQKLPEENFDDSLWAEAIMGLLSCDNEFICSNSTTQVLTTMFSENNVIAYPQHEVKFKCTCSIEKMEDAIKLMGRDDALDLIKTHEVIEVNCEYCNNHYSFNSGDVDRIFGYGF